MYRVSLVIVSLSTMDKMFEISNLFSKKVQIYVDPIFEKNANSEPIFERNVNFEHFVNG